MDMTKWTDVEQRAAIVAEINKSLDECVPEQLTARPEMNPYAVYMRVALAKLTACLPELQNILRRMDIIVAHDTIDWKKNVETAFTLSQCLEAWSDINTLSQNGDVHVVYFEKLTHVRAVSRTIYLANMYSTYALRCALCIKKNNAPVLLVIKDNKVEQYSAFGVKFATKDYEIPNTQEAFGIPSDYLIIAAAYSS